MADIPYITDVSWDKGSQALKNANLPDVLDEENKSTAANEVYNVPAVNSLFKELNSQIVNLEGTVIDLDQIGSYLGAFNSIPYNASTFNGRAVTKNDFVTIRELTPDDRDTYNENNPDNEIPEKAIGHPIRLVVINKDASDNITWSYDVTYSWNTDVTGKMNSFSSTPDGGKIVISGTNNISVEESNVTLNNVLEKQIVSIESPSAARLMDEVDFTTAIYFDLNDFNPLSYIDVGTLVYQRSQTIGRWVIGTVVNFSGSLTNTKIYGGQQGNAEVRTIAIADDLTEILSDLAKKQDRVKLLNRNDAQLSIHNTSFNTVAELVEHVRYTYTEAPLTKIWQVKTGNGSIAYWVFKSESSTNPTSCTENDFENLGFNNPIAYKDDNNARLAIFSPEISYSKNSYGYNTIQGPLVSGFVTRTDLTTTESRLKRFSNEYRATVTGKVYDRPDAPGVYLARAASAARGLAFSDVYFPMIEVDLGFNYAAKAEALGNWPAESLNDPGKPSRGSLVLITNVPDMPNVFVRISSESKIYNTPSSQDSNYAEISFNDLFYGALPPLTNNKIYITLTQFFMVGENWTTTNLTEL